MKHRYRVRFTPELLLGLFEQGETQRFWVNEGIPADASFVAMRIDKGYIEVFFDTFLLPAHDKKTIPLIPVSVKVVPASQAEAGR